MKDRMSHYLKPFWDKHVRLVLEHHHYSSPENTRVLIHNLEKAQEEIRLLKSRINQLEPKNTRHFPQSQCNNKGCLNLRFQEGLCLSHFNEKQYRSD